MSRKKAKELSPGDQLLARLIRQGGPLGPEETQDVSAPQPQRKSLAEQIKEDCPNLTIEEIEEHLDAFGG